MKYPGSGFQLPEFAAQLYPALVMKPGSSVFLSVNGPDFITCPKHSSSGIETLYILTSILRGGIQRLDTPHRPPVVNCLPHTLSVSLYSTFQSIGCLGTSLLGSLPSVCHQPLQMSCAICPGGFFSLAAAMSVHEHRSHPWQKT